MEKIKVVVTGGAGFIGSHIVEYWNSQNAEIHIIDNLRSGYLKNINQLKNIFFHNISITDRKAVFDIMQGVTYIHHLAAMVSVPESVQYPLECVKINVEGLINVLDAAVENNVNKIVHSSSAAVYGDNPASPKNVDMKPMPKSPYGITKLDGEYYLQSYQENFGLKTTSLRYFNVFGTRQDPKSQYAAAIPIFINKAIKNEPIIIYGDGEQTRDFIYVKDVVNANILAATTSNVSGVFNVALGQTTTINNIAKIIIEETKSKSEILYESVRAGDIKHSHASIDNTVEKLKFKPRFSLAEGLKETIKYYTGSVLSS
ncbi:MAG: NAD-dependent epimerase/dehydratase family protein [Ignavibacteriaceae bacterium]|jgi:UDP-glucose 4-epimerase